MIDVKYIEKGILLSKKGLYKEAEIYFTDLLRKYPNEYNLLAAAGLFYVNIQNYSKAIELLEKAYNIKKTFGTVSALGFAQYELGDYQNAVKYLEESLEYGENSDVYNKLVQSLFEINKYQQAVEYAEKMYSLYPEDLYAISNKIKALTQTGKLFEAQELCAEYLKKHIDTPILWHQLGYLKELIYSDDEAARECYKAAAKFGSNNADYNIAVSCQKLGEYKEAEKYYKSMLSKFPNDEATIVSLGMCYLTQKKFKEGYDLFFKRVKHNISKMTNNPWYHGAKLDNDLVIICEQGFGDHIQFIRYIPFLSQHNVKIAVPNQLRTLFEYNYPNYDFIEYDKINPDTQSIRITDLAYVLDMDFDNIPFAEGYLDIDYKNTIKSDKKKVGLCWEAGSAGIRTMINRTIHVRCFEPFFNLDTIQLYSFQYTDTFGGNEKYPQLINLAKDFRDFSDTARALKQMDVLITVDTSVAHLAGALGVKTYLLLPYASDWRWFSDTKNTPWYNSVEIFKQTDHISWEEPFNSILEKLK